ncbi:DUF2752 domain-containing protein [Mangrovimonas cancribranchiae]|uniref:DUF2752 domain-containing protein n=1 Tax=Mangrovimonas cancribranchiae TaxID=3080055 RepID=A0AAU6NZ92_9FLAO
MATSRLRLFLYIIIAILLISAVSLYFFVNPSSEEIQLFPKCPFYRFTGLYCPGCGSQRAIHDILNGHFIEGLRHNYLFILLGIVLGYEALTFIRLTFFKKETYNLIHTSKFTITVLIIVLVFWFLRNLPLHPFTELAP